MESSSTVDGDDRALFLARLAAFGTTANLPEKWKAIVGPANLANFGEIAESARAKLRQDPDAALSDEEQQALELALRLTRPAPLVVNGSVAALADDGGGAAFPAWNGFRDVVRPVLRSIGRLDRAAGDVHVGTGFLVTPNLVLTNAHVLSQLSYGTNVLKDGQAVIRFKLEDGADGLWEATPIRRAIGRHPSADLALLVVDPIDGAAVLQLATEPAAAGDAVVVVGFPGDDESHNPYFVPLLFGDRFGLKRTAPGLVRSASAGALAHDATTMGGNSGSPIFAMGTGMVVGVHNSGEFMWSNGAVPAAVAAAFVEANWGQA